VEFIQKINDVNLSKIDQNKCESLYSEDKLILET